MRRATSSTSASATARRSGGGQKVIEESPSPVVSPALREAMGRDAVAAARAVGYVGAGTVEFIVDQSGRHFFLEMNTRLQVEHPVTECVTGLDLVEWQLRIAAGEPLPLTQEQVAMRGHAIEVRLYAEDPTGASRRGPARCCTGGPEAGCAGLRIDHGITEGSVVSPHYDAMVAKMIAHGRDRDDAIRRLRAALAATPLLGLRNNARFLRDLLRSPDLSPRETTTARLDEAGTRRRASAAPEPGEEDWCPRRGRFRAARGAPWRPDSVAAYGLDAGLRRAQRGARVRAGEAGACRSRSPARPIRCACSMPGPIRCATNGRRAARYAPHAGRATHCTSPTGPRLRLQRALAAAARRCTRPTPRPRAGGRRGGEAGGEGGDTSRPASRSPASRR